MVDATDGQQRVLKTTTCFAYHPLCAYFREAAQHAAGPYSMRWPLIVLGRVMGS